MPSLDEIELLSFVMLVLAPFKVTTMVSNENVTNSRYLAWLCYILERIKFQSIDCSVTQMF